MIELILVIMIVYAILVHTWVAGRLESAFVARTQPVRVGRRKLAAGNFPEHVFSRTRSSPRLAMTAVIT